MMQNLEEGAIIIAWNQEVQSWDLEGASIWLAHYSETCTILDYPY